MQVTGAILWQKHTDAKFHCEPDQCECEEVFDILLCEFLGGEGFIVGLHTNVVSC